MLEFNKKIQEQFKKMCSTGKLFRVSLTTQEVWDLYLNSFEDDPQFRDPESSSHNCNTCRNFIKRYGNIVAIDENYQTMSLFDFDIEGEFNPVAKQLSVSISSSEIKEVFFETFLELQSLPYESCKKTNLVFRLGVDKNFKKYTPEEVDKFKVVNSTDVYTFNHMHLDLPTEFVDQSGKSVESIMGTFRDAKNVFQRAMETISLDTLTLVKDLINQGSLLDGQTHLYKIDQIIPLKTEFDKVYLLSNIQANNWCWVKSYKLPFAKFRNELIGVLCTELSEGEELNKACQSWNKRVDPSNYMKAKAPITQKQIEEARKFIENNNYTESFNRRLATIDDIKVSEIIHTTSGNGKIKEVSIFDNVKSSKSRHKRNEFEGVEEIGIDKFIKDILPGCTSVEAFLTNNMENNLVTLTTANNPDSKQIFKWDNNYSWTYNGNLAGKSQIKDAVKSAGGKVDGVLRFSIMWADGDGDNSDLDAHCYEPSGHINFRQKYGFSSGGNLDVDIQCPSGKLAVENITYPSLHNMIDGQYKFQIHQYSARNSKGFKAEIEFDGQIYSYEYKQTVSGLIDIATVILKNGQFTIKHIQPATEGEGINKEIYGLETNNFHKVNLVCLSPNHWGINNIGNKHYFFMIDGCKATSEIRSFHNENLIQELADHRKVLEVLGSSNMVESTNKQLSGLGFNATVKDELIVKLKGSFSRVLKLKFN